MIRYSMVLIGLLAATAGCKKVIEPDNLSLLDDQQVYTNITYIRNVLNTIYSGLPDGYDNIGTSWLAAACDEAEEVNNGQSIQDFNLGAITPYSNPDGIWGGTYKSIRIANEFLQATDTITWKYLEYSYPVEYERRVALVKQYRAEARFLKAFFYFELVKRYGGVPIVDEVVDYNTDWIGRFPRRSFASCVDFITAACDAAAADLPDATDKGDYGRATKGAALALKARTLLYAASDLYNRPANTDTLLGYVGGDQKERWIKAAEANREVLSATPAYAFHGNYKGLFLLGSTLSKEVIFERRYSANNGFEKLNTAVGLPFGLTGTCPSGNLVDAYEHVEDGDFNWNNPVHAANPYVKRDPRLANTVVVNNATFGPSNTTVELWTGGSNARPRDRASKTGYYLRKHLNESLDLNLNETATRQWVYMRLSEFYLNYAEAMNEAFGPEAMGPGILNISARSALNSVRTRAAVKLKAIAAGATKERMRELVRRERQVELAFENHRFWDVRRWMIAPQAIGGALNGVEVTKNADNSFSYKPIIVENRYWNDRHYYYPIPSDEVNKAKGVLVQNSGW